MTKMTRFTVFISILSTLLVTANANTNRAKVVYHDVPSEHEDEIITPLQAIVPDKMPQEIIRVNPKYLAGGKKPQVEKSDEDSDNSSDSSESSEFEDLLTENEKKMFNKMDSYDQLRFMMDKVTAELTGAMEEEVHVEVWKPKIVTNGRDESVRPIPKLSIDPPKNSAPVKEQSIPAPPDFEEIPVEIIHEDSVTFYHTIPSFIALSVDLTDIVIIILGALVMFWVVKKTIQVWRSRQLQQTTQKMAEEGIKIPPKC